MTYFIRLKSDLTEPVDKAHPFIFEDIQLFTWYHNDLKKFQVIEATTGIKVSEATTEEEAIRIAKELISNNLEKVKQGIAKWQKEYKITLPTPITNAEAL